MVNYSPQDKHHAFNYASERLRQESIFKLKMSEPSVYAFINIKEIKDGWKNKAGLVTEPGQKLAPYRSISYDTSILECDAFSCIPADVLRRPSDEHNKVSECNFAEHTALSFPVKDVDGNVIRTFTACGPGCYRRRKKRDPHTGLPKAEGALMTDYTDPNTGEKMCQYLNQNLIMWSAIPWSRPGKEIEGYNSVHVPGFGFEKEANGEHALFNKVGISKRYCNFFKQYYDEGKGECYRSGWMKFVKFMFGQYFTNLSYDLVNPQPGFFGGDNTWGNALTIINPIFIGGKHSPFLTAGAKPSGGSEEKNAIVGRHILNFDKNPSVAEPSSSSYYFPADETLRKHFGEDDAETVLEFIGNDKKSSDRLMEVSDSIVDAALRLEVMGLDDNQSRRLMLKEMRKRSRQPSRKGGFANITSFSHALKLVGITLAIKKSLFSKRASERRRRCSEQSVNVSRWSAENITERDALLVAKANLEMDGTPQPFLDVIPAKDIDSGNSSEIWVSLLKKYSKVLDKTYLAGQNFLKGLVVNIIRQFLDILEGKIFTHGYEWENNVPLMVGADVVLRKVMAAAGKLCTKFATTFESRAVTFASDYVSSVAAEVTTEVTTRVFGVFLEESIIEIVISAALRTAIQAFVALAELAASVISVIGVILVVVTVLGAIIDLSLQLSWYDRIMKPDDVSKAVEAFERVFAQATHSDEGVVHPVTAEEIVAIDVHIQLSNETEMLKESGDDELTAYLEKSFHESSLLGKSSMTFMLEAAEEYLAGRTMNAFGQRIIHNNSSSTGFNQRARTVIAETGNAVQDYSNVVNYNASRINYVGDAWVKNVTMQESGTDVLFRRTVALSAAAGFALAAGLGAAIAAHLALIKTTNIGLSLAFVGLLVFITLTGIAFIDLNGMGEMNAKSVLSMDTDKNDALYQSDRVGATQRFTGAGARFNMVSDFVNPMLDKLADAEQM